MSRGELLWRAGEEEEKLLFSPDVLTFLSSRIIKNLVCWGGVEFQSEKTVGLKKKELKPFSPTLYPQSDLETGNGHDLHWGGGVSQGLLQIFQHLGLGMGANKYFAKLQKNVPQ